MTSWNKTAMILLSFLFALFLISGCGGGSTAEKSQVDKVAIEKYDPVAYFTTSDAIKGNDSYTYPWHNMIWYFSTPNNRDLFAANPEKYAPQYDGYCAWAMSEGRKAKTDPEVWRIVDGKLYLNCSRAAYEKWRSDITGNIKKADNNWLKLSDKN